MPDHDDEFNYSLCTIILTGGWANFTEGRQIAAVKSARAKGIPTDFRGMMAHPKKSDFLGAFKKEIQRYWDTGTVMNTTAKSTGTLSTQTLSVTSCCSLISS